MDIKDTYLFCSIRNMVHKHIPMIYEQINRDFFVLKKDIWKDLEQVEVIQQYQTYWGIETSLSNMIFDTGTLKPIGTIFGRVRIEHYSHLNHISLSYYTCNLLSTANNDFANYAPTQNKIYIQDLNNKRKVSPYLAQVENFLCSFPELFLNNIRWVNLNLEYMMKNEKFCYIQNVNNEVR